MEYRDYYAILEVPRDADAKTIKSAYRRLARKYHPDVNPDKADAERRFKELNEAHEVLSDPEKRKKYDQFGADWQRHQQPDSDGGFDWSRYQAGPDVRYRQYSADDLGQTFGGQGFSDFFSFLFGDAGEAGADVIRPGRGRDIEQVVTISLAEAYAGTARRLKRPGGPTIEVKIPAGVEQGRRLRVKGQGGSGRGRSAGDLWLVIDIAEDPRFERRGDDLHARIAVPVHVAVLGGDVTVPLVSGRARLRIPPETQNGTELRMRGQGMPGQSGGRGDLVISVEVRLPSGLTRRERELWNELAALRASES
jgi:DnaJ-class molecular chaperone